MPFWSHSYLSHLSHLFVLACFLLPDNLTPSVNSLSNNKSERVSAEIYILCSVIGGLMYFSGTLYLVFEIVDLPHEFLSGFAELFMLFLIVVTATPKGAQLQMEISQLFDIY